MSTVSPWQRVQLQHIWTTVDPFLFCVHHEDFYPRGDARMAPKASLEGRNIGMDFAGKDGWSMYHGDVVPGFPRHPHRGFETITIARRGYIDHSDSLGATARFGQGDVQWMTAGKGVVHSEMFPLVHQDEPNPTELFQIWLNLPRKSKFAEPHFTMLWHEEIPSLTFRDRRGLETQATVIAGKLEDATAPSPPPSSWASDPEGDVAVFTLQMDAGASWTLPAAPRGVNRMVYFFKGESLEVGGHAVESRTGITVPDDHGVTLTMGSSPGEALVLAGRPIAEPVAQQGPFVMNEPEEIRQAMIDFHTTGFGGWTWGSDGPVHERERGRFAIHADGREEIR